jgi:hypothetical protein
MKAKLGVVLALAGVALMSGGVAQAQSQYPIMEKVAQHVIEKYQSSSCQELASKRGQPPSAMEERVVVLLQGDPSMRAAFINRVAAPIANKLFECHLIP